MKVFKGAITDWNKDKGFGFVRPLGGTDALFVHISSFGIKSAPPLSGQVVYFTPSKDKQGRRCATIVDKHGTPLSKKTRPSSTSAIPLTFRLIIVTTFFVGLISSYLMQSLPVDALYYFLVLSLTAFTTFAIDKRAAQLNRRRISERSLQILSLLGGWPGALLAQQTLRHKSQKRSFRIGLWLAVMINSAILIWLTYQGYLSSFSLIDWVS
ncbi:DUF1294 domain-containing protein [Shewanella colwelliana]|uniref:DUF1294 domain-containing protein n=1 Tax=Shewanella colwelliana TaxID=23 RepID=UPI0037361A5A